MRRRRLIVLCATFALLALAGGAGAAPSPVKRAPSLLWRSYPLKQRTAATQPRPLRPPALADGARSGSGGGIISPYLTLFALFGGASLALAGLLAKKFLKEGTARKGHSAQPARASTEEAKPDMLVALRPGPATAEEDPVLAESQPKAPVAPRTAQIESEGNVEPERSDQAPSAAVPPLRPLPRQLFRPIEDQLPEVRAPAEKAESLPLELVPEFSPEPERLRRDASREDETEAAVECCQIRLWRGYFRYQLYVAPGGSSGSDRAVALSPYFRLSDPDAPGDEAMAALRELLEQLETQGWTVSHEGWRWYSFTLERPL